MTENTTTETGTNLHTPGAYRPCTCSTWEIIIDAPSGDVEDTEYEGTGCAGTPTTREFAPGHDAKLKSLFIKAGVNGNMVASDGLNTSAEGAAARYGFLRQVKDGIHTGQAKLEARRMKAQVKADKHEARATELGNRAQAKAAAKAQAKREKAAAEAGATQAENAPALPMTSPVTIKVGRWEYAAELDELRTATYVDGKGETQTREEGTYRLLGQ